MIRLLVVSGVMILLAGLVVARSEDAPIAAKYEARSAVATARAAGAETLAPSALAAAEEALSSGVREMTLQLSRFRWNRSFERAEARLAAATRRARLAESRCRRAEESAKHRARKLIARADDAFDHMEWLSAHIPPGSPIRSDIKRARVDHTEAMSLYDQGEYLRAAAAAREANADIEAATARFARFLLASADPSRRDQYARWVRETLDWSRSHRKAAIIVDKMRRTLTLVSSGRAVRTYAAELGINGTLAKIVAGDRATPEGRYRITEKRGQRQTRWYKALVLNYPNEDDLKRFEAARRRGQIPRRSGPGSLIEIHGEGGRGEDWTDGCVALANREMDDLFSRVSVGTPVTIVGFEVDETVARAESLLRRVTSQGAAPGLGVSGSIK